MINKRIVIHVGLPKTASTYLQEKVFPFLDDIFYVGRPYTQENHAFNMLMYADETVYDESCVEEEIDRLKQCSGDKDTILISDEMLSGYPLWSYSNRSLIARRLARVCPHAEIVIFLRNPLDLIKSLYNQYAKIGWIDLPLIGGFIGEPGKGYGLDKWLSSPDVSCWDPSRRYISHRCCVSVLHFNYLPLYELYLSLFSNVHVFSYEEFCGSRELQLDRLISILGCSFNFDESSQVFAAHERAEKVNLRLRDEAIPARIFQNKMARVFKLLGHHRLLPIYSLFIRSRGASTTDDDLNEMLERNGIAELNKQLEFILSKNV